MAENEQSRGQFGAAFRSDMATTIEECGKTTIRHYLEYEACVGEDYIVESLVVLGPYPSQHFFIGDHSLAASSRMRSARITLVADDGWPSERLAEIEEGTKAAFKSRKVRIVRASNGGNLVHAKAYYACWRKRGSTARTRTLLLGSANASKQGFGANAESYVSLNFRAIKDASSRAELRQYFEKIEVFGRNKETELVLDSEWFWIGKGETAWASLPALTLRKPKKCPQPSSFESWIRRGYLCHKYAVDSNFGRVRLRLKRSLPPGILDGAVESAGFGVEGDRASIATPYLPAAETTNDLQLDSDESEGRVDWLAALFVETRLGYWTSEDSYIAHRGHLVYRGANERRLQIQALRDIDDPSRDGWVDAVCSRATTLRALLVGKLNQTEADAYFSDKIPFEVWLADFRLHALNKIKRDQQRARDEIFCDRYISGFDIFPVPATSDEIGELALSFCATIALKVQGKSVRNLFAARIRKQIGKEFDDSQLLTELQSLWEASSRLEAGDEEGAGLQPGAWLQAYYQDWLPSALEP
ncbi:MAG: hypothetical protein KDA57_15110 [Planctomycetales bacterium]|nr:hypothetical protein [Planctomycetales bacterium]